MAAFNKTKAILERILMYCNEINCIAERFGRSFDEYTKDSAYRHACGMCLMQIGELASRLPEDFREINAEIPWKQVKGMRNVFAHEYENVSNERAWEVIETHIPVLSSFCEKKLRKIDGEND